MHSISTAAASHVKIGPDRFDVVCWTISDGGRPLAWFLECGELTPYVETNKRMRLLEGTATDGYENQL